MPSAKLDRLMLTAVCKANLSQVFGLFPDAQKEAGGILDQAVAGLTPLEAVDCWGVIHRMWPVTNLEFISDLARLMAPKPIFIADGHHRYETACKYREEVYDSGFLRPDHPANYVLMACVAMEDPGLMVLPTHRLFGGLPELTSQELAFRLAGCFDTEVLGEGPEAAGNVWEQIEAEDDQGTLALFARKDQRWIAARVTDRGRAKMAEVAEEHSPQWQQLGVSLLHRLILETLLGEKASSETRYVHLIEDVVEGLRKNQFPLAALVMPATVDHIRAISMQGERMPPKSTYFFPKLLAGLVINPLE